MSLRRIFVVDSTSRKNFCHILICNALILGHCEWECGGSIYDDPIACFDLSEWPLWVKMSHRVVIDRLTTPSLRMAPKWGRCRWVYHEFLRISTGLWGVVGRYLWCPQTLRRHPNTGVWGRHRQVLMTHPNSAGVYDAPKAIGSASYHAHLHLEVIRGIVHTVYNTLKNFFLMKFLKENENTSATVKIPVFEISSGIFASTESNTIQSNAICNMSL